MTSSQKLACSLFLIFAAVLLTSSCGGGGGSSTPTPTPPTSNQGSVSFSTKAVSFTAAAPFAEAPATQTITGTVTGVTSGTVYVTIQVDNPSNFFMVTNPTITGNSGQVNVTAAIPSSLHAGSFSGSITVSACVNDASCKTGQLSGSPETVAVSYNIDSGVDGDTVTPRVIAANKTGTVILRGGGFTGATNVSFGSLAASSISVVSDSEIDVLYPAMAVGTYPVTINSGGISYRASLIAVSPPAFTATAIPYPSGDALIYPDTPGIEYDAERTALFVLLPGGNSVSPTLVRYAFDANTATWGTPTQISMAGLEQIHLSPDGTQLLGMVSPDSAHTSIVELDPVTMAQTKITTASNPANAATLCGFAIANDGNAIVGLGSLASAGGFAFGTTSRVFTLIPNTGICNPVASGNGAVVALGNSNYVASSGTVTQPGAQTDSGATGDFAGNKFVYSGTVEDQAGQLLGIMQGLFGQVINSAGTRAYGLTFSPSGSPSLATFDLTATPSGSPDPIFPELGTPITLAITCPPAGCGQGSYALAISPDGSTVLMAGPDGVIVQPLP